MTIVYKTEFAGIALDVLLESVDAGWVPHISNAGTYRGSAEYGGCVYPSPVGATVTYFNMAASSQTDCEVSARIISSSGATSINTSAVLARVDLSSKSYYGVRLTSSKFELYKRISGNGVTLATMTHGLSKPINLVIGLRCVGDQISALLNGVVVHGPVSDTTFSSGFTGITSIGVKAATNSTLIDDFFVDDLGADDTSPPTLTNPTASAIGASTASGSVSTNEANGALYWHASSNASESVATVKAGSSRAVTAPGTQGVSVSGLTASTAYYLHFVHTDASANDSTVATSSQFTTAAASTPVKGGRVALYDGATARAGQTALRAMWWDSTAPDGAAPAFYTANGSTDEIGVMTLNIDAATSLAVGAYGYLHVHKAGTASAAYRDALVFSGALQVEDIQ